jgi:hypothetical protein
MARTAAYSLGIKSGTMAAGLAGAAPIIAIRWSTVGTVCVIRSLRLSAGSLVGFTAGFAAFDLITARAWSAADTGGNAVAWTVTGQGKRMAGFPDSAFATAGEIRYSDTATLSAGTRTLDTNPMGVIATSVVNTAGAPIISPNTELVPDGRNQPIVLNAASAAASTGLVIRATVPATGTWQYGLTIDWEEMESY